MESFGDDPADILYPTPEMTQPEFVELLVGDLANGLERWSTTELSNIYGNQFDGEYCEYAEVDFRNGAKVQDMITINELIKWLKNKDYLRDSGESIRQEFLREARGIDLS
jgi:hypothetical protein